MMPPKEGQKGGNPQFLIMMVLIFVVFYFFMIRPQVKRQKELEDTYHFNFYRVSKKNWLKDKSLAITSFLEFISNLKKGILLERTN